MKRYKVYLAGPWFNEEQKKIIDAVEFILMRSFSVYSPRREVNLVPGKKYSVKDRQKVVDANLKAISRCDFVVCITDYKDVGTLFEAGVGYEKHKPIVYVAVTLGDKPFNLMLANTGSAVAKSIDELTEICKFIKDNGLKKLKIIPAFKYLEGAIE